MKGEGGLGMGKKKGRGEEGKGSVKTEGTGAVNEGRSSTLSILIEH